MERESRELYQSGDAVEIGVYRSLATGGLARIRWTGDKLPEEPEGRLDTYEWISGDPDWNERGRLQGVRIPPRKRRETRFHAQYCAGNLK